MIEYIGTNVKLDRKGLALVVPTFLYGDLSGATDLEKRIRSIPKFNLEHWPTFRQKGRVGEVHSINTLELEGVPEWTFITPFKYGGISYANKDHMMLVLKDIRSHCYKRNVDRVLVPMHEWGQLQPGMLGMIEQGLCLLFEDSAVTKLMFEVPESFDLGDWTDDVQPEAPTGGGGAGAAVTVAEEKKVIACGSGFCTEWGMDMAGYD